MTFKKNYEDRDFNGVMRRPKQRREVNTREEARVKNALRHGDVDQFYDLTDDDIIEILDLPDESEDDEADSD